jgi:hypothetical protein
LIKIEKDDIELFSEAFDDLFDVNKLISNISHYLPKLIRDNIEIFAVILVLIVILFYYLLFGG